MRGTKRLAVPRSRARASASPSASDSEYASDKDPVPKRRKTTKSNGPNHAEIYRRLVSQDTLTAERKPCLPPSRKHTLSYHAPLLLDRDIGLANRKRLLAWFDSVSTSRSMPWRQTWINPRDYASDAPGLRKQLERRAYQVWISEIMLQQTRVAAVIEYWNRWMEQWPTIQDLAQASRDDVLAAWRGLGYYSRATRIHEAAKAVVEDSKMVGLLPATAAELAAKVPGVGRYTAGAISSIVFGRPEPMVDGNVLRVLSRQLGILGDIKADKAVIDIIWAAADSLVKAIGRDGVEEEGGVSDRPGRWGQGLMELGSTVCTPKPNCAACPITDTCRAYNEGAALADKSLAYTTDIEDLCNVCTPFEDTADDAEPTPTPARKPSAKQMTLAAFGMGKKATKADKPSVNVDNIIKHVQRFPIKSIKKAVRQEETLVCAIRRSDGRYLIHRRPEKGLLAGLWEFPSHILEDPAETTPAKRKQLAREHVTKVLGHGGAKYAGDLGSVPWLFSHIKLTMHVHFFTMPDDSDGKIGKDDRWSDDVDSESMGTGMRKCWELVQDAN